jgi:hypothetical protein
VGALQVTVVPPLMNRLSRGYMKGLTTYQLLPRTVMGEQPSPIDPVIPLRSMPRRPTRCEAAALVESMTLEQH